MNPRTQALLRVVEHPLVRLTAAALLQAAADRLGQPRTGGAAGASCAKVCARASEGAGA